MKKLQFTVCGPSVLQTLRSAFKNGQIEKSKSWGIGGVPWFAKAPYQPHRTQKRQTYPWKTEWYYELWTFIFSIKPKGVIPFILCEQYGKK